MPEAGVSKWVVIPCPEEGGVPASTAQSEVLEIARVVCEFSQLAGLNQSLAADSGASVSVPRSPTGAGCDYRRRRPDGQFAISEAVYGRENRCVDLQANVFTAGIELGDDEWRGDGLVGLGSF
ncbi:unnamed protein product [Ostreobium quekettii]|uniref:Uncharacterized protein n=1 Tax=Ostreobium quekettii TaxID=121088 RepID=A0A8S1JGW9_9CHLO|nr:unnamed protein product [Ostreobium quekettii]